jgi:hypothetical protein
MCGLTNKRSAMSVGTRVTNLITIGQNGKIPESLHCSMAARPVYPEMVLMSLEEALSAFPAIPAVSYVLSLRMVEVVSTLVLLKSRFGW